MRTTVVVELASPATEMAREEIPKQIAFLSKDIESIRFERDGAALVFEAPEAAADSLREEAARVASKMQRSLRSLTRKLVYRSPAADAAAFRGGPLTEGIHMMARGQVALEGLPLRLYRYFDRTLEDLVAPFEPSPLFVPTLIPPTTLARCDYFRSFPHVVTFASHLPEDVATVESFRRRHEARDTLDEGTLGDLVTPEVCLSPAVCYHAYSLNQGRALPASGARYSVCGRCFRYESSKMTDLRRLWEFTMRELVLLGRREDVLRLREEAVVLVSRYLEAHELAAEIRTASDPFFISPDAGAKSYFQISSETKYEISLFLPDDERLAAGSLNYHTDFFGRAFACTVDGLPMESVCVAHGLERWVYGFLAQHGDDPSRYPAIVRDSRELAGWSGAPRSFDGTGATGAA